MAAKGVVNTVNYVAVIDAAFEVPSVVNCVNAVLVVALGRPCMQRALELLQVINASSITILPAKPKRTTKNTKGTKKTKA